MGEGEPVDQIDAYDKTHGSPSVQPSLGSEEEQWGNKLNPVQETPPAFTKLSQV